MLADAIRAYPDRPEGQIFGFQAQQAYRRLSDQIALAPRFDLQRDAIFLIENLSRTVMPSRIVDALGLCRLPFPVMWVEFVFKDRSDWVSIATAEGRYSQSDWGDDQPNAPQRLGILLEEIEKDDGYKIEAKFVWNFNGHDLLNFCSQSLVIDLEQREPYQPTDAELAKQQSQRGQNSWAQSWHDNLLEEKAAVDLERRLTMRTPEHMKPVFEYTAATMGLEEARNLRNSANYDLAGEWKFLLAFLMVMNSRNVVSYGDEVSFDKLNKKRVKAKKPPLLSHRPVTLHLSRAQHMRMGTGGGGSRADLRPHLVRGHFKLRKTGLFFWSSHMRRDETGAEAPTYRVKA